MYVLYVWHVQYGPTTLIVGKITALQITATLRNRQDTWLCWANRVSKWSTKRGGAGVGTSHLVYSINIDTRTAVAFAPCCWPDIVSCGLGDQRCSATKPIYCLIGLILQSFVHNVLSTICFKYNKIIFLYENEISVYTLIKMKSTLIWPNSFCNTPVPTKWIAI